MRWKTVLQTEHTFEELPQRFEQTGHRFPFFTEDWLLLIKSDVYLIILPISGITQIVLSSSSLPASLMWDVFGPPCVVSAG